MFAATARGAVARGDWASMHRLERIGQFDERLRPAVIVFMAAREAAVPAPNADTPASRCLP